MSAPNFSAPNLSCVYAVWMNEYDFEEVKKDIAECNDIPLDEVSDDRVNDYISMCMTDDYENSMSEIKHAIEKHTDFYACDDYLYRDRHAFAKITLPYYDKEYKNWDEFSLYVTVESGYYQWAQIDMDFSEYENIPQNKTTQKKVDRAVKSIEKILTDHCLRLRKAYQFSNWEAGYSIIK